MKLAFLYAGQGSQAEGMGKDFYDRYPQIRPVFDSQSAGLDLRELCFESPLDILSQTEHTQPCLAAFAVAVTDLLHEEGIRPDYAAGLSLGEYSALYAAGVFDRDSLLATVAYRGRVMTETTSHLDTAMVAVLGLDRAAVEKAVSESCDCGVVACANFNYTGQIVIGGEERAVAVAADRCLSYGARRCLPLNVSGPFHTPLMNEAADLLAQRLAEVEFGAMEVPVVFNATGRERDPRQSIAHMLEIQVKSPVLFEDTILYLAERGVDTVVEIGPGRVLSGFIRKTAPQIKAYAIGDIASFEEAVQAIKGE